MAKESEWARCEALRKLIAQAIEDAWFDEDKIYLWRIEDGDVD